jgi:hypothetical protein
MTVTVKEEKAYVADKDSLLLIDVRDPKNPMIIGSVEMPASARRITVAEDRAYIANGKSGIFIVPLPVELGALVLNSEGSISANIPSPRMAGNYSIKVFNGNKSCCLPGVIAFAEPGS